MHKFFAIPFLGSHSCMQNINQICLFSWRSMYIWSYVHYLIKFITIKYVVQESRLEKVKINEIFYVQKYECYLSFFF